MNVCTIYFNNQREKSSNTFFYINQEVFMPRRKKQTKKETPYLSTPAMQKMAEGFVDFMMSMFAGEDINQDNKEKQTNGKNNKCTHSDIDDEV